MAVTQLATADDDRYRDTADNRAHHLVGYGGVGPTARLQIDQLHAQILGRQGVRHGDIDLGARDRPGIAHKLHRGQGARLHQHIAGGDGFNPVLAEQRRSFDVLADQQLGVATTDQRQKENRVGSRHYLAGAAGKADHGDIDPGPDALKARGVARRKHQTGADEDGVGPGLGAKRGALIELVRIQTIWIQQGEVAGAAAPAHCR